MSNLVVTISLLIVTSGMFPEQTWVRRSVYLLSQPGKLRRMVSVKQVNYSIEKREPVESRSISSR